jgi:hypothetical protein
MPISTRSNVQRSGYARPERAADPLHVRARQHRWEPGRGTLPGSAPAGRAAGPARPDRERHRRNGCDRRRARLLGAQRPGARRWRDRAAMQGRRRPRGVSVHDRWMHRTRAGAFRGGLGFAATAAMCGCATTSRLSPSSALADAGQESRGRGSRCHRALVEAPRPSVIRFDRDGIQLAASAIRRSSASKSLSMSLSVACTRSLPRAARRSWPDGWPVRRCQACAVRAHPPTGG